MSKPKLKIRFRIPPYISPRTAWRREIHRVAAEATRAAGVRYRRDDELELDVRIFLPDGALGIHDVDNRLKDIMDALQGHVGGKGKKSRALRPLIPNDHQIFRVVVEKESPPKQSRGLGHIAIRSYQASRRHRIRKRRAESNAAGSKQT